MNSEPRFPKSSDQRFHNRQYDNGILFFVRSILLTDTGRQLPIDEGAGLFPGKFNSVGESSVSKGGGCGRRPSVSERGAARTPETFLNRISWEMNLLQS